MSEEKHKNKKWVVDHYRIKRSLQFIYQYDQEKSWKRLCGTILHKRLRRRIAYISSSVAVVVLVLTFSHLWFYQGEKKETLQVVGNPDQVEVVSQRGVILSLSDGRRVNLSSEELAIAGNVKNDPQAKQLAYEMTAKQEKILKWNTLEVPRGSDYQLMLSDGSRIWLNARSRLTYPETFGKEREVILEGEAYFEVTQDEKRPFVVRSNHVFVRVLGTEFNMNTYNPERIQTVLVKGKVEMENDGKKKIELKPGELAETVGAQIQLSQVNVRKYVSWKEGEFYFEDATLDEIMQELADWYDVRIIFTNQALRNRKFSGVLERNASIVEVLKKIERTTTVHFEIQEKIVKVK